METAPQLGDYIIENRSNGDMRGPGGLVEHYVLTGPGIATLGLAFSTREEAEAKGRARAAAARVSLWRQDCPPVGPLTSVEDYRATS